MSKLIIETVVKVDAETIEVTASTKVRELAVEKKVFYKGADVANLITDYDIIEVLKDYTIANTKRANYSQRATWFFKIKKSTTRKTKPAEAKPAPKIEHAVEKPPAPTTKPAQTKASTKRSIRGRMSKIAKDKQGE